MEHKNVTVVLCEEGKLARITEIDTSLASLQRIVGGLIEFYYITDDIFICLNEEGKINGMNPNRAVKDESGEIVEFMFGPFFIAKESPYSEDEEEDDGFTSLSEEEAEYYMEKFFYPEDLFVVGHEIVAIPYDPEF